MNSVLRLFAFAAPVLALLLPCGPLAAQQQPSKPPAQQPAKPPAQKTDQDAEYQACLDLARKKPDAAMERAKKWWDTGGSNFGPRHCLAIALVSKESYGQAGKLLEDLAKDAQNEVLPLRADLFDQAGQAYFLGGMNDQALAMYDQAIKIKPREADFLIDRAVTRDELGQHFEAIDDLNLAIEIAPDRAEAWLYRANAYRHINSLDLALEDANRAVALSQRAPEALLERATIKSLRKDEAGARADLQAIVKLAPNTLQGKEAAKRLKTPAATTKPPAKPPAAKPAPEKKTN